jgi:3-hydroxyisobutyrate dehydrogenase-like beta-hydroxyacid dehydrogenase
MNPAIPLPSVGIIGIGAMGMAIARNLHERTYPVLVRDVRSAPEDEARALGMTVCATPHDMAVLADVIIVVVVNAEQIDEVISGVDGVLATVTTNLDRRRTSAVILCSTIAPQDTARFAARLTEHGLACIDAPISGGPARARAGSMSMMLAAPEQILDRWSTLLSEMAARRFVISAVAGDGAKAKLVNNMLAGANLVAGAEALALAAKLGLDTRLMFELICASSGASWIFADRMARALDDDYQPRAAAHILTKDVGLATALARSVDHPTPLADAALARFKATLEQGWAELDDAAVIKTWLGQ